MAYQSICPKCENNSFEVAIESPKHSNFKFAFVRCERCGTVVGVSEYYNIGERINLLAKKLNIDLDR